MLGVCYSIGWGVDKNDVKAFEYYTSAANNVNYASQYNLAICYATTKFAFSITIYDET